MTELLVASIEVLNQRILKIEAKSHVSTILINFLLKNNNLTSLVPDLEQEMLDYSQPIKDSPVYKDILEEFQMILNVLKVREKLKKVGQDDTTRTDCILAGGS